MLILLCAISLFLTQWVIFQSMYFERAKINLIEGERSEHRVYVLAIVIFFVCYDFAILVVGIIAALCGKKRWITIFFGVTSLPAWVSFCALGGYLCFET